MRIAITLSTLLIFTVSSAADFSIVGSWSVRDNQLLPTNVVFGEKGGLAFKAPGLVVNADCRYTFDDTGSPKELTIHCEPQLEKVEGRFWVTVLSDSAIHVRSDQLNSTVWSDGLLSDTVLDKVGED